MTTQEIIERIEYDLVLGGENKEQIAKELLRIVRYALAAVQDFLDIEEGLWPPLALQDRVTAWHKQRFPEAQVEHIALKLCEEAGEVASAVNALVGKNSATGDGNLPEEVADVAVCAMVLLGRFGEGADLLDEVEKKFAILNDPKSGHRAARLE